MASSTHVREGPRGHYVDVCMQPKFCDCVDCTHIKCANCACSSFVPQSSPIGGVCASSWFVKKKKIRKWMLVLKVVVGDLPLPVFIKFVFKGIQRQPNSVELLANNVIVHDRYQLEWSVHGTADRHGPSIAL